MNIFPKEKKFTKQEYIPKWEYIPQTVKFSLNGEKFLPTGNIFLFGENEGNIFPFGEKEGNIFPFGITTENIFPPFTTAIHNWGFAFLVVRVSTGYKGSRQTLATAPLVVVSQPLELWVLQNLYL